MKHMFVPHSFSTASLVLIDHVNTILDEYDALGYDLSLRQLYYQLVARGLLMENSQRSYKNVGNTVNDARLAGLIDWKMIRDRGRETVRPQHWETPADILMAAAEQFRIDKWQDQPNRVLVMVEKDALSGVLVPACGQLDVPFTANKGYSSSSALYQIATDLKFLVGGILGGSVRDLHILYLGDHGPSGIDMTRDVRERLHLFLGDIPVTVHRLALNMDQVEALNPPENPAKEADSRYTSYVEEYGESSWELDAIEPTELVSIVRDAVIELRDSELWDSPVEREAEMRGKVAEYAQAWRQEHDDN
jgi:hypothetical protein